MDVDSVTAQLLPCPVMLEAVERGGSAGCVKPRPASVQLQTHQQLDQLPLPLEGVVWMVVCEEMRCCLRPGNYHEVPCFLPGSADGFHRNEPLTVVERIWIVRKGRTLHCLAVVLVEVWEEYVKARKEKRGAWRLEDIYNERIMRYHYICLHQRFIKWKAGLSRGAPNSFMGRLS